MEAGLSLVLREVGEATQGAEGAFRSWFPGPQVGRGHSHGGSRAWGGCLQGPDSGPVTALGSWPCFLE